MLMSNELFELARKRRSIRKYTAEKIEDAHIDEILKIALLAPSSWGIRAVEFFVVKNKETIRKLSSCKKTGASHLAFADTAIVVMVDISNCELWIEDGAVASTYILLAAEQLGIGACWIQIRNRFGQIATADEEIRDLLGIPVNYSVLSVIALGYKEENKRAYTEKDLRTQNIHYEKF